jgi:hypothetical protein
MLRVRTCECRRAIIWLGLCLALSAFANRSRAGVFTVTNLVTDDQAVNRAQITDPFLKNAWGISRSAGGPFWVSDNATGVTTLYKERNPSRQGHIEVQVVSGQ